MKSNTIEKQEWKSIEEIHAESVQWLSGLEFIDDEQEFIETLLKKYFIRLSSSDLYSESRKLINQYSKLKEENLQIIAQVENHENHLAHLFETRKVVDKKALQKEHQELTLKVSEHYNSFLQLKEHIFSLIKSVMHEKKRKLSIEKQ